MNNEYFNRLSQSIKAYIRYIEKVNPTEIDGGFANSTYVVQPIDGGNAPDIDRTEIDGGVASGFYDYINIKKKIRAINTWPKNFWAIVSPSLCFLFMLIKSSKNPKIA
mgnify:CR=1 FL=1